VPQLARLAFPAMGYTDWRAAAIDAAGLFRRFRRPSKRQAEMAELRRDLDACLMMFDHLATPGNGDWSAQWDYISGVLDSIGKRGISGSADWLDQIRGGPF
jgi:hypothetical protein